MSLLLALIAWVRAEDPPAMAVGHRVDANCAHCHDSPHADRASGCADCHVPDGWRPTLFDAEDHAALRFPLAGLHLDAPCGSCHVNGTLTPLPTSCAGCHVDRHRGLLGDGCDGCHAVSGWLPVEGFDHEARTSFALAGPHAEVACEACHAGANGRAMRVLPHATCDTCHTPEHGPFRGLACDECHDVAAPTTFTRAILAFDHTARTAFPLERRHLVVPCASCHPVGGPDPSPRCGGCHLDPHGGQMGSRCEDCHRPDRWRLARFDHDRTGFVLRGRHFVTPCGSCHTNQRWIGLSTACEDCHAFRAVEGPASVAAHRNPARCSDCHLSTWTFRIGP